MGEPNDSPKEEVAGALRDVRERVRSEDNPSPKPSPYPTPSEPHAPLGSVQPPEQAPTEVPTSPSTERLNESWDISTAFETPPPGRIARIFSPLRRPLRRLMRFAVGPVVERQVELNSAQVQFGNELVQYIDARLDRISAHYDRMLGLHGKRMEEIDERHLILQQELVRHVHELVKRIDFVFETAEQNHLYLEGMLKESREELRDIARRARQLEEKLSASAKR